MNNSDGIGANYEGVTADEIIEAGLGLIARGMFRLGDKSGQNDPRAAYEAGMSAISVIRGLSFDFLRKAS